MQTSYITLYKNKPKRLFAFGCSFTEYNWTTWPEIIAYDLDIPFYNFARSGAGNYFMFNQVMQANSVYKFTPDDLIMICWTNTYREDRYIDQQWQLRGNIFSHIHNGPDYPQTQGADIQGFALRDFSMIAAIDSLLSSKDINYHFLAMCDITERVDQYEPSIYNISKAFDLFKPSLDKILPSFYQVLWNNDLEFKKNKDKTTISEYFWDGHPSPSEHLEFLTKIYGNIFSKDTISKVDQSQSAWIAFWKQKSLGVKPNDSVGIFKLSNDDKTILRDSTIIKFPEERSFLMM